jgi:phage-related protein
MEVETNQQIYNKDMGEDKEQTRDMGINAARTVTSCLITITIHHHDRFHHLFFNLN